MASLSPPSSPRNSDMQNLSLADQNMMLAQQLETAKTSRSNLNAQLEFLKKKYQGIQDELQFVLQAQTKLEKQYYSLESELETTKQREEDASRKARELEFKLTSESKESELEKNKLLNREEQLTAKLKTLQTQLQLRVSPPGTPPPRVSRTRSVSVNFSPPSYISTLPDDLDREDRTDASLLHEARLANRTVRQQIKEISELKASIKQLKEQISILISQEAARTNQIEQLNHQIAQLTLTNSSHLEEIESYQLLLEERTLRGQFSLGHRSSSHSLSGPATSLGAFNLSSELAQTKTTDDDVDSATTANNTEETIGKKNKDELQMLKDENKALALYISKILGKIMSNPVLAEAITANGDSRRETESVEDFREVPNETPRVNTTASPKSGQSTRSSLSPQSENKVAFAFPDVLADGRKSTNLVNQEESVNDYNLNGNGLAGFRARRSKSMSVAQHPALGDTSPDGDNQDAFLAGVFSFRNAFKKVTGPWKTSPTHKKSSEPNSPVLERDPTAPTTLSDPVGQ